MRKVKSIAVSRLLKGEVQVLLENVIYILNKYNLEALRLKDLHDILVGQAARIQFFTKPHGAHPLTFRLDILRKERLDCASFIAMQVRSFEKSTVKKHREKSIIAKRLSGPFLHNLGQKGQFKVREFISVFFINLDGTPEAQEAFTTLGLKPYVEELRRINNEYFNVYKERELDIICRPPTGDRALERETQRTLRHFFEQVNSSQSVFSDIDYSPLISELNTTLVEYSRSISIRITTNKRRANKKAVAKAAAAKKASIKSLTEEKDNATLSEPKPLANNQIGSGDNSKSIDDEAKDTPKPATGRKAAKRKEIPVKNVKRMLKRGGRGKK